MRRTVTLFLSCLVPVALLAACEGNKIIQTADLLDASGEVPLDVWDARDVAPDKGHDTAVPDPGAELPAEDLPVDPDEGGDVPGTDAQPEAPPELPDQDAQEDPGSDPAGGDALPDADDDPGEDVPGTDLPVEDTATDPAPGDPGSQDASDATETTQPGTCPNAVPEIAAGTCAVQAGTGWVLIQGHILVPRDDTEDGILRNGQLLIGADGVIRAVGCDAVAGIAEAEGATKVLCREALVTPGLINGHDHITYTGNTPKAHGTERYEHRHQWRRGLDGHTKITVPSTSGAEEWGELRNVLGGATSMFGSGKGQGLLRNLDQDLMAGIDPTRKADYETFPLDDTGGEMLTDSCAYPSLPNPATIASKPCWVPHVAEGINQAARNELLCLSSTSRGGVNVMLSNTGVVHGVGVLASDIAAMTGRGVSLIWSPRTNIDLYGQTAAVTVYARMGHNIGLGSDWTASGSVNMMRELRCAQEVNDTYLGGYFGDRDLLDMATVNNAKAFRLDDHLGVLAPGHLGDVAVWNAGVHPDERAVLDAAPGDVVLVMRGGMALYGDDGLVAALTANDPGCESLDVCQVAKRACVQRETGSTLATLQASGGYGLFFCGIPDGEPSCIPFRPGQYDGIPKTGDMDGDGIADESDLCPSMFDPVRPLDGPGQPDWDGDGIGDACDPCPMDDGTTACRIYAGDDLDGDLIPDAQDLCPTFPDDGSDRDKDGKGDGCDPCPDLANPGTMSCPGTIYQVKSGTIGAGSTVRLQGVQVTGYGSNAGVPQGFFVQHPPTGPGYAGTDNGGLYIYRPSGTPVPAVGDRIDVDGTVTMYYGQVQLSNVSYLSILSSGNEALVPVVALPADVATGGSRAAALEGSLVQVMDVTVTDVAPAVGAGDKAPINEFVVTGGLRIDDFLHLATPFPLLGDRFTSISGVLRYASNDSKLEPRDENDLARADIVPELASFGPAEAFALEGETGATVPVLKVRLARSVGQDVTVQVASSAPDRLDLPDGGAVVVPAGAMEAEVPVVAKAADPVAVTLTAQLDTTTLTADVRVVGPAETPVLASGVPASLDLQAGKDGNWTLTTDIPNFGTAALAIDLAVDPSGVASVPLSVPLAPRSFQAVVTVHGDAAGDATVTAMLGTSTLDLPVSVTEAPSGGVFISEYVEGSSFNKAIEVYNGSADPIDLSSCSLTLYANGSATATATTPLADSGTLAPGATWVLCNSQASADVTSRCQNATTKASSVVNFNGDDAVTLACNGMVVDVFGQVGFDPGTGWGVSGAPTYTGDHTLRRKCGVVFGDPDGSDAFDPSVQWDGSAKDTFDGLGSHSTACP